MSSTESESLIGLIPEIPREVWIANFNLTQEYTSSIVLPPSWKEDSFKHGHPMYGLKTYLKGTVRDGLRVIVDCSTFWDNTRWVHVSCSRRNRIPSYEDLVEAKAVFIGPDRQALQCFPKKSKHINIHPNCLHLWCCLDGDGLPDFGRYGTI